MTQLHERNFCRCWYSELPVPSFENEEGSDTASALCYHAIKLLITKHEIKCRPTVLPTWKSKSQQQVSRFEFCNRILSALQIYSKLRASSAVNKLMPYVWVLSGALEVWSLRFRYRGSL